MGAKVTADLLKKELITRDEAEYLLSFCNNTSPIFIINFIVWKTFGQEELLFPHSCHPYPRAPPFQFSVSEILSARQKIFSGTGSGDTFPQKALFVFPIWMPVLWTVLKP